MFVIPVEFYAKFPVIFSRGCKLHHVTSRMLLTAKNPAVHVDSAICNIKSESETSNSNSSRVKLTFLPYLVGI